MEVNTYKFQELNLASQAIIEKLQQLAIEKQRLEEAIRIQRMKEEQELFLNGQLDSLSNQNQNERIFFDSTNSIQSQQNQEDTSLLNQKSARNQQSSKQSFSQITQAKSKANEMTKKSSKPSLTYGKFKENYQSFASVVSNTSKNQQKRKSQGFTNNNNIKSSANQIEVLRKNQNNLQQQQNQISTQDLNKPIKSIRTSQNRQNQVSRQGSQDKRTSSVCSNKGQQITNNIVLNSQKSKVTIIDAKKEVKNQVLTQALHKSTIPQQKCNLPEIQTDPLMTISQLRQSQNSNISNQSTKSAQNQVFNSVKSPFRSQTVIESNNYATTTPKVNNVSPFNQARRNNNASICVIYSKINERSSSKGITYNQKMKEEVSQEVTKQIQTLQKFQKDSNQRRNYRGSCQSSQRETKTLVHSKMKEQPKKQTSKNGNCIIGININNLPLSNATTFRKTLSKKKTEQEILEQNLRRQTFSKQNNNPLDQEITMKSNEIWYSICQERGKRKQKMSRGRNLMDQFKTLDAPITNDISPKPHSRTSRGNGGNTSICLNRAPSVQQKSTKKKQKNIRINPQQYNSISSMSQLIHSSKTQKRKLELEDNISDNSNINVKPFNFHQNIDHGSSICISPNRERGSLQRSTISCNTSKSQFRARPFQEKQGFVVKKSTKILTVPSNFNFNTVQRADERSNSKNSRQNTIDRSLQKRKSFSKSRVKIAKTHQNSTHRNSKVDDETPSLLDKLIKEYDLEKAFQFAQDQLKKNQQDIMFSPLNTAKIEDLQANIPQQ